MPLDGGFYVYGGERTDELIEEISLHLTAGKPMDAFEQIREMVQMYEGDPDRVRNIFSWRGRLNESGMSTLSQILECFRVPQRTISATG